MDLDRIRKQKIDKTYIDEAFKEIPMYESMAVSSEKDTYRLAKELLTMGHISPKQTRKQTNDNLSDASAPTLQSLYLSPGGHDDPSIPGQYDASGHSSQKKSENKEVVSLYDDQLNISERNILPQILRDKPLESPSKARFDPAFSGKIGHTMGVNYIRTESHAIQEDLDEDGFPRMEDIEEFKGKFSDVKKNVMKALVEDLQKKENDYFVINTLKSEKTGKMYPHKIFVVCHSEEAILDPKHIFYKDNFNFLRSKLAPYFSVELKEDKRQLIYLYMIYQKGKTWEYIKVMVEGTKSTGVFYRHSQYNPFSTIEAIPSEILDRYVEGLLKTLVGPQPVTKKISQRQRVDKGFSDTRGCSIWDTGIEVYKRISKDYAKLSQEKISREQMTFLLWEKFYERQLY